MTASIAVLLASRFSWHPHAIQNVPIGIASDIEKAFLQMSLHTQDRDVMRFLWLKEITQPPSIDNIVVYRFARVRFGVISSPFLLAETIRHHLSSQSNDEQASEIVDNTYVDNILISKRTTTDAQDYYAYTKSVFSSATMNLREWASNDTEYVASLPANDKPTSSTHKCLVMNWDTALDTLAESH